MGYQAGEMGDDLLSIDFGSNFNVTAISSGDGRNDHHCALSQNATLVCWGENILGKLGIGDNARRSSPKTTLIQFAFAATPIPSAGPTADPTTLPSPTPSANPTSEPTANPTASSSESPTTNPSLTPSQESVTEPTFIPSDVPTFGPSKGPTSDPSASSTQELPPQGHVDSTTALPSASGESPESSQGMPDSNGLSTRDLWVLIGVAVIVSAFLFSSCAMCVLRYYNGYCSCGWHSRYHIADRHFLIFCQ